ncbi:MAG: hypothetical protein ACOYMA_11370 [Bacteroidia bacterium]
MSKIISFIFLLFFSFSLSAQNTLSFTQNGKISKIICKPNATYENINGKINLSITTENNQLLELNNIDEKLFVCGRRLSSKAFKMVLIDNKENITYISNSTIQILLQCNKSKDTFTVIFSGLVQNKTTKINITSKLFVKKTPRKNLKTN